MNLYSSPMGRSLMVLAMATATVSFAEGNPGFEKLGDLKSGVSTRKDVVAMLGKPKADHKMEDCSMCTWSDGDRMVTCVFDKKGVLQDVKEWKARRQWPD